MSLIYRYRENGGLSFNVVGDDLTCKQCNGQVSIKTAVLVDAAGRYMQIFCGVKCAHLWLGPADDGLTQKFKRKSAKSREQ